MIYPTNVTYQEKKIKELLSELSSVFSEIQLREEVNAGGPDDPDDPDDMDFEMALVALKNQFFNLSKLIYKACSVYLESNGLPQYLNSFVTEIEPYLKDKDLNLSSEYHEESGEVYSEFEGLIWGYLVPFEAFGHTSNETLLKRTGLIYLENILESTAVILREANIIPTKETEVYKAVKVVSKATFPTAQFPSESFQKTAKNYIPDILIPSLNCAVEYKYAETEQKLIATIDEILIDVKGYDKHPTYKIFFAVFYVKPGIWTRKRFEEVWREKEFPSNWKGIMVEGIVS